MNIYVCDIMRALNLWEEGFFSENVAAHVQSHKRQEDRARSKAAYAVLARALSDWRSLNVRPFEIGYSVTGKPFSPAKQAHFSLSHSGSMVAAAVSDSEVGVDIEQVRKFGEKLIARALSQAERELVHNDGQFCRLWTQKESFCKLTGSGITTYPDRLDTTANFLCKRKVYVYSFDLDGYALSACSFSDVPAALIRL